MTPLSREAPLYARVCALEEQVQKLTDAAKERCKHYERVLYNVKKEHEEICQIAGKALGYSWYKDDQKNFPGADESWGVCVGEHVATTIVAELAHKYNELKAGS